MLPSRIPCGVSSMRLSAIAFSILLITSVCAEPAFAAAANGTTQNQQNSTDKKPRPQTVKPEPPQKEPKDGGLKIHAMTRKNVNPSGWLSGTQSSKGWSF